jgi:hypothetical protein
MTGIILVYIYNFYIKISTFTDILKITKHKNQSGNTLLKIAIFPDILKITKTHKNQPKPF